MTAPTPRVAESIDDLRVGQVVVAHHRIEMLEAANLGPVHERDLDYWRAFPPDNWTFYILSDPPPEPVTVSREAFDRLAARLGRYDGISTCGPILAAARALVDEVRAAE